MPNELVRRSIQDIKERNLRIIIDLATKYMVSPEVAARKLLLDLSEFDTSIVIFKEPNFTNKKNIWWFYGNKLRSYIRNEEKKVLEQFYSLS